MKIAVIGAKGMLGSELCRVLGKQHEMLAWDIDEIDITDRAGTLARLGAERPDLIINSAALVNVEVCEAEPDKAWRINAVGAQNLALAAQQMGSALLYISTDYIFDGQTTVAYDEVATPNPINQYGRSKLAGERLSLQNCQRTYSIRTAWIFGHSANSYVQRVLNAADKDGVVRMPEDQLESPTYTIHLAEAILRLIATGAYGIYNVTSLGACTRADFAKFVLQAAGRSEQVEIVDSAAIQRPVKRPPHVVLDCRLIQLVTGQPLAYWRQAVQDYFAAK
ncbi:MAG: dTDP-4-dehydrorhamnose reductase [Caldilineaceae bacterium]